MSVVGKEILILLESPQEWDCNGAVATHKPTGLKVFYGLGPLFFGIWDRTDIRVSLVEKFKLYRKMRNVGEHNLAYSLKTSRRTS